jgi:hypothetical protein
MPVNGSSFFYTYILPLITAAINKNLAQHTRFEVLFDIKIFIHFVAAIS